MPGLPISSLTVASQSSLLSWCLECPRWDQIWSVNVSVHTGASQRPAGESHWRKSLVAQHRKMAFKEDYRHVQTNEVRSQLCFLEEQERRERREDEERETLLRKAKGHVAELELQHREANLTALVAIGPRKTGPRASPGNQVQRTLLP
ncbi:transcription initiation factor TFIID subunit 4B-like [Oncorhynchus masou masou]|uniref:transcription initiation factor TFIID subunit 4B-like n=1 Tax=Oncorhynchus masou masou TaxID=90313 RepID=UPI0031844C6E